LLSPHFADVHVMLFRISAYAQYQVTPNHQKKSANVSMARPRIRGVQSGIGEVLRIPERCWSVSVDGDGQFQTTLERVRKHLRESKAKRVLVGAVNDSSALGALRAYEEAGRASECVIVGQNAEPEARAHCAARIRG
jgi:ABC-type sugar transport system substrate-binding protein